VVNFVINYVEFLQYSVHQKLLKSVHSELFKN